MTSPALRNYLRAAVGDTAGPGDADLIARFAAAREESAFELLVWRHAALVQRVCRAVLGDHHAAEDAAQATFLALARKAHTIDARGSVVGWLYRVARRVAGRLAKQRARRPVSSEQLEAVPAVPEVAGIAPDEAAALWAEVDRLPERYRVPVLLCFFEGLTHAEAARRTGWPVGTVAGRLARAKDLLARRLSRRGVGLVAVALGVPAGSFVGATAQAAAAFAAGRSVVPGIDPSVTTLAEDAMKAMTASTWKLSTAAAAVVCALTAGVWGFPAPQPPTAATPPVPPTPAFTPTAAAQPKPAAAPAAEPPKNVADAAQRARSINNLKQILLAMHNYHDATGHFPNDFTDKDGKPLLSWRVAILPYIEHDVLYRQFKLDEPWDSVNNKKLLAKMPLVYLTHRGAKDETKTYYQGFAGKGTLFESGEKIKLTAVTDGTSYTCAVIEAGPPVEWTKPADISYDPKKALPGLDGPFSNVLIAATADGAVHTLRRDLDEKNLRRFVERADGEPVQFDELRVKVLTTPGDVKEAMNLLRKNENLLTELAAQFRDQQKLLEALDKARKEDPVRGVDLEQLGRLQEQLEQGLVELKKKTEELRKQVEEAGKK